MNNFHDINFPQEIAMFALKRSEFVTSIVTSKSGREARNPDLQIPRRKYLLENCYLSSEQFESFYSFFNARSGRCFAFRLRDQLDYKIEKQFIAISDGSNKELQLYKTYPDAISPYKRIITKPVKHSVEIYVKVNESYKKVEIEHVNTNTGKVYLAKAVEKQKEIFISCTFDVPVRFYDDNLQHSLNIEDGSIKVENVELVEVI